MNKYEAAAESCCINGYTFPSWVLDKATDKMKRATRRCRCEAGRKATERVYARLGLQPQDLKGMEAACKTNLEAVQASDHAEDEEALAAWDALAQEIAKANAAAQEAAYAEVWAPRYAAGYTECTRCGGTGFVAPYGTCFRCEGRQVDPKRTRKEARA